MKFNKILIVSLILISLFAIGAVSATDNNGTDVIEISDADEVQAIDEVVKDSDKLLDDGEKNLNETNAKVHVDVDDTERGENIQVNVSVTDVGDDFNFTEVRFNLSLDGRQINAQPGVLDENGKCQLEIDQHNMNVGRFYIEATLYNATDGKAIIKGGNSFNINPNNYILNVENIEANPYEIVTIPVTVTDSKGNKVSIGGQAIVTISWSGDSLSKRISVQDGEGQAVFNFTDIIGIFNSMDFESMMGDNGAMNWGEMFSGAGANTTQFDWKNMNWSDMGSMFSDEGFNWTEMFSEGGMTDALANMMAVTFEYIFTPGIYTVNATLLPSQTVNGTNATSNLTILYPDDVAYLADVTVPKKYGDNTTVKLKVVDKRSIPMPNITVNVIIDGENFGYVELDENATAKFVITNLRNGDHKLEFSTPVNGTQVNGTTEFSINVPNVGSQISAKAASIVAVNTANDGKVGEYFTATLKDSSGNVLPNKKVQITIATKKYTVTTDEDGVAKLQLNIAKANTYTCSICFLADNTYNSSFEMVKVTVKKQASKIAPAKKSYTFKVKAKKTVKVTLKNAKGKAIKGKYVTLKIKNKTFKAKTNNKGVATIKVNFAKKGKYTALAKFAGDNTYKAISKKVKVVIK